MISEKMIGDTQSRISAKVDQRLLVEAARLPPNALAAGQYLDVPGFAQRGLYGTAAAIRVLADGAAGSPAKLHALERLLFYVTNRESVERSVVPPAEFAAATARMLELQRTDAFRLSDLCFALAFVSPAVPGKSEALTWVSVQLQPLQLAGGGYAVAAEKTLPDALATGHMLRALAANNLPTRREDWDYVESQLATNTNIYIRCFLLYVLSCWSIEPGVKELKTTWKALFRLLGGEFEGTVEANYEYTRFAGHDYVRLPWQLYLIQASARLFPLSVFNGWRVQSKLTEIAEAVLSVEGFRYTSTSPNLSTRTYACVFQMLDEIATYNFSRPLPRFATKGMWRLGRVAASRAWSLIVVALMLLVGAYSVWSWIESQGIDLADLGPNVAAELVLIALGYFGMRARRR